MIVMCVSAFPPASQHLGDHGDRATQLDIARPAFDAGAVATTTPVVPATLAIATPSRSVATVATVATVRAAADVVASSQLARGPPV
jgi:hypothetical protein